MEEINTRNTKAIPHWTNFLCPSCAVYYGIDSLVKVIKRRTNRKESVICKWDE